uniref:Ig-like domain-containing protein n=1 Tax=Naja naja TaxID=35670 RepID=A0A8C6YFX3_NAJNA
LQSLHFSPSKLILLDPDRKGTAEEDYVEIWPPNPVVKFGGSLHLNCTSNCEDIGIESAYTKVPIGNGSNWKAFLLSNLDDWAASPLCYADCKTGQKKSPKANIIIYKSPEGIELDPVPEMEVGKQYNLICRVFGVAPIRDLTVTLLKGEEQLLVKTFKDHTQLEAGVVVVNHRIRAQQNDYNKTITCQTSLDLRPAGPLLTNTSHGISLRTFGEIPSIAPLLRTDLSLEAGTLKKVTCEAPEVSPADEATFDLRFAGKPLTFITTVMGGLASAQAEIASSSVGDRELICTVSLGPVTKTVKKTVNVFACNDAQQEDNEREFICQVTLTIDGQLPQIWTWKEGSTTTLTCSALGNPTATVQCWKDGRLYKIGKPQLIQIEHDGIYQCNATNQAQGPVFTGRALGPQRCPDTVMSSWPLVSYASILLIQLPSNNLPLSLYLLLHILLNFIFSHL